QTREELPVDTATSLALAGARDVDRQALAVAVLTDLAAVHAALTGGETGREAARAAYRRACTTIGSEVDLHLGGAAPRRVHAVAVDDEGRLVVRDGDSEYAAAAGDVVHVRPAG